MSEYREKLISRYWAYQKDVFSDVDSHFERPYDPIAQPRPPVFHKHRELENVIIKPGASQEELSQLFALIPIGERHKWYRSMNSSQALAQSVLGNLSVFGYLSSLTELFDDDAKPLLGRAQVNSSNFRMEIRVDYLGEPRSTSLDGYIGGDYQVAIEAKFTEPEVGSCSRPRLTPSHSNYASDHCDGSYTRQRTRKNRCSLTEIGVLYWPYVQKLFHWDTEQDITPCPLNANYQLVRNLLAAGVNRDGEVSPDNGHALLIYDDRNPAFQKGGKGYISYAETRQALREPTMLRKCSWQRIVQHMRYTGIQSWLTKALASKYGF